MRVHNAYREYRRTLGNSCQFCEIDESSIVGESDIYVIRNVFPYETWDGGNVINHLLVIPKHHVESLKDFTYKELKAWIEAISHYEHQGYSIYTRGPGSQAKSVVHHHTHLILTEKRKQ